MTNPSPASTEEVPVAPPATRLDDDESEQSITMEILEPPEESEQSMTMEALEPEPPPKSPAGLRRRKQAHSPNSGSKSPAPRPTRRLPRRSKSTDGSVMPSSLRRRMIPRSLSTDGSSTPTHGDKRSPIRRGVTLGGSNAGNNRLPIRLPSKSDRRLKMRMASEFSSERGLSSTDHGLWDDLSKLLDENLDDDDNEKRTTGSVDTKRTESVGKMKAIKAKLLSSTQSSAQPSASLKRSATFSSAPRGATGGRRPFERSHSQSKLKVAHTTDIQLTDGNEKEASDAPAAASASAASTGSTKSRQHFAMPSRRRKAPIRRANSMSAAKEELFVLDQDLKEKEQQNQEKEQEEKKSPTPISTPEKEYKDSKTKIVRSTSPSPKSKKNKNRSPTSPKRRTAKLPPKRTNSPTLSPSSSLSRLTPSLSPKTKKETAKLMKVLPLPSLSATRAKKTDPVLSLSQKGEKPRSRSKNKNKGSSSKQPSYQKLGSKLTEKFSSSISGFSNSMTGLFLAPDPSDSKKCAPTTSKDDGDASKATLATVVAARRKKKMKLAQRGKGKSLQQNRSFGIVARSATSPTELRRMSSSFSDFEDQQFKIPPKSKSGSSYFQWKTDRTAVAAEAVTEKKKKDKALYKSSRKAEDKYSRTSTMRDKSVRSSSKDKSRLRESSKKSTLQQQPKTWDEDSKAKETKQMDPSILKKSKTKPKEEKARRRSSDLGEYYRDIAEKDGEKTRSKSASKTKKKEKKKKDKSTKGEEDDIDLSSDKMVRSSSASRATTKQKKKKQAKKEDLSMSFSSFFGNKSKKPDENFDFSSLLPLEEEPRSLEDAPSLTPLPVQAEENSDFLTLEPEIVPWEGIDIALPEIVPGIDVSLPELIPGVDVELPEIIPEADVDLPEIVPWEGVDIALRRASQSDAPQNTGGSQNVDKLAIKEGQAPSESRAGATSFSIEFGDGLTAGKDKEEAEKLRRELAELKEERERARNETNKAEQEARQQKEYAEAMRAELVAAKKELRRLKKLEKGAKKKRNKASEKEQAANDTQKIDLETSSEGTPPIIEKQQLTQLPVEERGPDMSWEAAKEPKHDDTVPEATPEKILHDVDTEQPSQKEPMEDDIADEPDMRWEVPQVLISATRRSSAQDSEKPAVKLQDACPTESAEDMEIEKSASDDALSEKAGMKLETCGGTTTGVNAAFKELIDQSEREMPKVVAKKERRRSSLLDSDGSDSDDESQTTPTGRRRSVLDSSDDDSGGDNDKDAETKRGPLLDSKDNASEKGDYIKSIVPRRSAFDSSDDETDSDSDGPNASKPAARRRSMLDFGSSDENTGSDSDGSSDGLRGKRSHDSVEIFESSMSHVIPLDESINENEKKRGKVDGADEAAKSDSGGSLALNDLSDSSDSSRDAHYSMPHLDVSEDILGELPRISSKKSQRRRESKMDYHASCSALDFVQLAPQNFVQQKEERFGDYYELGQILGEGEFGEVFVGYPRQGGALGEERAIKIIDKSRMCDGDYEQVMNEFNLLKGLTHPNILTLYGFFEDTEKCYIVTDICKGGEMWDELHLRGSFAEEDAAAFMTNVLSAVKFLQSHKIVHRDINLENILLEENKELDQMKIIDFGLATKYEDGVKLTDLVGKVHYVPPEVLHMSYEGSKYDVWSCGVLCFIMLSGYAPFEGDNDGLVREQVLIGKVDFNDPAWESISDEAKDFVNHLLTYEEDERPLPEQALKHAWIQNSIKSRNEAFMESYGGSSISCLENMEDFAHDVSLKLRQAVYTYIASQLLFKEEREEIDNVFRGMDEDCDGQLSKEDIKQGYKRFFDKELSEKELGNLFRRINTSGTGFIDYTEFVIAAMQKSKILDQKKLQAAFRRFDRGDKGFVSADDVKIALSGVIAFPENDEDGMSADDIFSEMVRQVDMEGTGTICYEDFEYMMMTSVPRAMDAEGEAAPNDDPTDGDAEEAPDGEHRNSIGVADIGESLALVEDETGLNYDWATTSWLGDGSQGDFSAGSSNAGNSFQLDLNVISEEG